MQFGKRAGSTVLVGLFLSISLGLSGTASLADNQTPTVTPVSTDKGALPYEVKLVRVKKTAKTLPNLQSFADGHVDGLWVIVGGRTSGLHNFTDSGLKNFPPRKQNDKIWVIDPETGDRWSRKLSDSSLSEDQVDALSSTAMESLQIGDTLYVIGGYGYKRSVSNFVTHDTLTAFDLDDIVQWVRSPGSLPPEKRDLADLIRQTSNSVLKVTGGQATKLGNRVILAFGQLFDGGYGDPDFDQVYTTQVRSFRLRDTGKKVSIGKIRRVPSAPNPTDYRRRDYTLVPFIEMNKKRKVARAAALAGVFTETDGVFTVPVEIDKAGVPSMADPNDPKTFKQAMSGYDTAFLPIWDNAKKASHSILFAGISFVYYDRKLKTFIEDSNFPFINDITALVRSKNGRYEQVLVGRIPKVKDADGKQLRFGAEAKVFIHPDVPVTGNGMVDLQALKKTFGVGKRVLVGYLFGGIAADAPNDGNTAASNLIFKIYLTTR